MILSLFSGNELFLGADPSLDLLSPSLSRGAYVRLLESCYGFLLPVEAHLASHEEWAEFRFDFESRRKTSFIEDDLLDFGSTPADLAVIPMCEDLPDVRSFSQALGCLYVLETASLATPEFARHLNRILNLSANHGNRFFSLTAGESGERMKELTDLMTAFSLTGREARTRSLILAGASETFRKFESWLNRPKRRLPAQTLPF